jgi:hypothetical protein
MIPPKDHSSIVWFNLTHLLRFLNNIFDKLYANFHFRQENRNYVIEIQEEIVKITNFMELETYLVIIHSVF